MAMLSNCTCGRSFPAAVAEAAICAAGVTACFLFGAATLVVAIGMELAAWLDVRGR